MMIRISDMKIIHSLYVDSHLMNSKFLLQSSVFNTCFKLKHLHVILLNQLHRYELLIFRPLLVWLYEYHLLLNLWLFALIHLLIELHSLSLFFVQTCILVTFLLLFLLVYCWIQTSVLVKRSELLIWVEMLLMHGKNWDDRLSLGRQLLRILFLSLWY